jgi:predicted LPLAT superfamily acyltransferase
MHTWLIRILRFIPIRALYAFVFLFVVPVCLVVNPASRIIYRYFRRQWGYGALKSALMTYRNFYLFGQVVVDRFAM